MKKNDIENILKNMRKDCSDIGFKRSLEKFNDFNELVNNLDPKRYQDFYNELRIVNTKMQHNCYAKDSKEGFTRDIALLDILRKIENFYS